MYYKVETWLNDVLEHKVPSEIPSLIRAFCFNLYEDENDDWSMELVGTESFDPDDEDWACDEITDFGTREEPLSWKKETDWNEVLSEVSSVLKHYLENGLYADILKSRMGVAVGFIDGNLEILYSDLSGMAETGITDKTDLKGNYDIIATQNIEANGEALVRDFISACVPEIQNSIPEAENRIPKMQKSADMRRVISFIVFILIVMFFLFLLTLIINDYNSAVSGGTLQQADDFGEENEELTAAAASAAEAVTEDDSRLQIPTSEETEEEISVPAEQEELDSGRKRWQVYIQPDMPEPFMEVLRQYEEFFNADNQDLNDQNVREKIDTIDGEWRFLDDELCGNRRGPESIRYSLTDLTGDGFPELIMASYGDYTDETFPEVVYYYSKTEEIEMEHASSYYTMTLYEGGIIEYESGGVNYTITYYQFRQDTEEWIGIDRFYVETVVDGEYVQGGSIYYREGDEENFLDEPEYPITEEEFKRITDGYTQKPVEPEWMPLTPGSESAAIH